MLGFQVVLQHIEPVGLLPGVLNNSLFKCRQSLLSQHILCLQLLSESLGHTFNDLLQTF